MSDIEQLSETKVPQKISKFGIVVDWLNTDMCQCYDAN